MEYMESMMQSQLEASLILEGQCEDIIYKLDEIARNLCRYEYGLPTHDCPELQLMKYAIRDILCGQVVGVNKQC
jgi:hypothetical protein